MHASTRRASAPVGLNRQAEWERRRFNVQTKSPLCPPLHSGLVVQNNAGSDLLSHTVSHAVPSAVAGLTSVFGMGTGVTLLL